MSSQRRLGVIALALIGSVGLATAQTSGTLDKGASLELTPAQQAVFSEISDELAHNGFDAEPFGSRSIAIKIAPAGVEASAIEHLLQELLDQLSREDQSLNMDSVRARIAASIACHAAIKVNMQLEQNKMEWLLSELAKTDCPMTCPHGRPVVLRYSLKDIQKAFKRI